MELRKNINAGFTLIELLVVLAIFVIVTTVVLFQYGNLRSTSSLSNLATDISLSIRQSQTYAIGAYNSGSNFTYGYGVHFSTAVPPVTNQSGGSNKAFVMFTDVSADRMYNVNPIGTSCTQQNLSSTSECTQVLTISGADEISAIYLNANGSSTQIAPGQAVDITFLRPNPDAHFCYVVNPSAPSCDASSASISSVTITIESLDQTKGIVTENITVSNTGQISTSE
jgi:prepilin-type N-terminal cleavage/methylation domain-containing protein